MSCPDPLCPFACCPGWTGIVFIICPVLLDQKMCATKTIESFFSLKIYFHRNHIFHREQWLSVFVASFLLSVIVQEDSI